MGAHAYAATNLLSGLAGTAFTWSAGSPSTADKALVNDGRMDKRLTVTGLTSPATMTVDLGSATALNGFALLNHNFALQTSGLSPLVTIQGSSDNFSADTTEAKAATPLATYLSLNTREPMNKDHVFQFATVTKRYWRIKFEWSSGTLALSFGEIFAYASAVQLTRKGIYGSGDSAKLYTSEVEFDNGETRGVFFGGPVRKKLLRWQDFNSTARDELRVMFYTAQGNAGKLLFVDSYEATATAAGATEQDCIYGRLTGRDDLDYSEVDFSLYQLPDFEIRSLGREVGA